VSGRHLDDDGLRRAFQALADSTAGECSRADLDRIWRAVAGELPAAERRALVERLATEPACAEAWRVAHALRNGVSSSPLARPHVPAWRRESWLAVAAMALLAASVAVAVSRRDRMDGDTTRDAGRSPIESLVVSDATLPRNAFRLRWRPASPDARYQVRVTTEDLRLLTIVAGLSEPEAVIDRTVLSELAPGSRVLWQVEVTLPTGEHATSPTFVARVQ
jgi:hypothetical protein